MNALRLIGFTLFWAVALPVCVILFALWNTGKDWRPRAVKPKPEKFDFQKLFDGFDIKAALKDVQKVTRGRDR